MLILTRRPHESLRITDRVRITVLGFKGNQVRIGIEAPPDVTVDREEVWLRKRRDARATAVTLEAVIQGPPPEEIDSP